MTGGRGSKTSRGTADGQRGYASLLIILGALGVVLLGTSLVFYLLLMELPSIAALKDFRPSIATRVYDDNNELIDEFFLEDRKVIRYEEIPKIVIQAFVAAEDARFFQHKGFDMQSMSRAFFKNIEAGKIVQGGSTITQQVAKTLYLSPEKSYMRKIKEALLAYKIDRYLTKEEIITLYLNHIYLGHGTYGVEAAAQGYFGKSVRDLNLPECALLAGLIRNAYLYSPTQHPDSAKTRRDYVLRRMAIEGYITEEQAQAATEAPLGVIEPKPTQKVAPYFVDYVRDQLIAKYGTETVYKGGLKVYTTLDLRLQTLANEILLSNIPEGEKDSKGLTQPQAAMIVLDAREGYIRAMVGGRGEDEFNRAVMSYRQPGSAFKPFVYTAALKAGYTPATLLDDSPVEFVVTGQDEPWAPVNNDKIFRGPVTLRKALEDSINVPSVKLLNQIGIPNAINVAKSMGITSLVESGRLNDMNLSLVLGGLTRGVSPLEMASAYAVFANQGIKAEPIAILRVEDTDGNVLERNTPRKRVVLDEKTAYVMTDMLRGVIARGTAKSANIGRPAAGKTGTTTEYTNAWFVGFTPELVACVWIGNDEQQKPMVYGGTRIGSSRAAAIWGQYMKEALKDAPVSEFPVPSGVAFTKVCTESGALATESCPETMTEVFIEGTEPHNLCYLHARVYEADVCLESGQLAGRYCPADKIERRTYLASSGLRLLPDGTISVGESIPRITCQVHTWWTAGFRSTTVEDGPESEPEVERYSY